jgi:histidinol-phosphate/aromatic aminotransferase/cobyric acid decarboxylase-like protein/choline kinase
MDEKEYDMKAIILAAGMGSRLKNITKDKTKCMVEVNGESLIKRLLKQLEKYTLEEIVIVTGYKEEILKEYINNLGIKTKIKFYNNDIYDKTNNIYSLGLVEKELLNNDILLIESDLIFEDKLLENIINSSYKNLAVVSEYESWMDGTCVRLDDENNVVDFISSQRFSFNEVENLYKTVNIYKLSKEFNQKYYIPFLKAYISSKGTNQYYESVFETLIKIIPNELKGLKIEGLKWYEIDDKQDLDIAESLFAKGDKLSKFQVRYGGYWRYPKLLDYCYLVNPYFPPKKMIDELKMNFQELLTQYPSGLKINNLLASKYFNIDERYVVVGNGAAELIKGLLNILEGSLGVIRPTFEEYPNRYPEDNLVIFNVENNEYRYSSSNIIEYFDDKKIENLILINPDNPSGNYISKIEVLNLLEWGKKKNIKLIIDESFVDFAIEENSSLLTDDILNKFSNLIVVKSISKSYGVPGLRLGVIATSDISIINKLKKEVSIWNINSFAEYYMQIYNKYEKLYKESLDKIKTSRKNFISGLKEIEELAVFDSEANYVMIKILEKYTSKDLAEILLNKYNILIKDLKGKKGINDNYIRLAIRDEKDNNYCLRAIKEIFKERD